MDRRRRAETRTLLATARTISEALPNIQRYDGEVIVVKFGGNAIADPRALQSLARDIALIRQCGVRPVLVHGGGPQIEAMLRKAAIESRFVDGLRITDADTMELVEMVLSGAVNKKIVAAISMQGAKVIGLSGKDAKLLICEKALHCVVDPQTGVERTVDIGLVGRPVSVNGAILADLIAAGVVPVVSPVGMGTGGETYNVNADTVAGMVAASMKARRLLLFTDVDGVRAEDGAVIGELSAGTARAMIAEGTISGGMIPKVRTALEAIRDGARAAVILNGRTANALLIELFTDRGAGTLFRP